jgi:IrrE N-terminal-like domain
LTSSLPSDPATPLWQRVSDNDRNILAPFVGRIPVPIGAAADAFGIEVVSLTLPSDISGLIRQITANAQIYQIQVNNTDVPVRQRFTVAHELAHFLLHRHSIGTNGITDSILYRSKLSDRVEAEANRLGAALLLPWEPVQTWCMARFSCLPAASHLDEIAAHFKVSALAVGFRFGF